MARTQRAVRTNHGDELQQHAHTHTDRLGPQAGVWVPNARSTSQIAECEHVLQAAINNYPH